VNIVIVWLVFVCFTLATLALCIYGLHLYMLLLLFRRAQGPHRERQRHIIDEYRRDRAEAQWPAVTSQIPIYNEADVAKRVMEAVAAMDYPRALHEIQVLDDSHDRTRELIDQTALRLVDRGIDVKVIRRPDRSGFKAGALAHGLQQARGTYVAVFDADFVPPAEFLRKAVPLLENDSNLACLQGRWDHLNRDESWLTAAQALGIDGHFAIEQGARAWNGLMMNFNGTAGVWRRSAIDDPKVGGWTGDTLTEDLDLSYRVQLGGWKLDYCLDLPCPAELPNTVAALKSQQRRWATGSIQVACKLLPAIWKAPLSLAGKLEATLHLTHYSVALWMLILALAARPMIMILAEGHAFARWAWVIWTIIIISAIAPSLVYAYARYSLGGRWSGFRCIPSMFVIGCGLCLNNAIAVLRGLRLRGGEFVRTPKSGSTAGGSRQSHYKVIQNRLWIIELLLGVYCSAVLVFYFLDGRRTFSLFMLFYALGFLVIGWLSRPQSTPAESESPVPSTPLVGVEASST